MNCGKSQQFLRPHGTSRTCARQGLKPEPVHSHFMYHMHMILTTKRASLAKDASLNCRSLTPTNIKLFWIWHSEDRASWHILIIKPREALISQIYFWNRTPHVSDRFSVHHQESSTAHTAIGISHTGYAACLLAGSGWRWRQSQHTDNGRNRKLQFGMFVTVSTEWPFKTRNILYCVRVLRHFPNKSDYFLT